MEEFGSRNAEVRKERSWEGEKVRLNQDRRQMAEDRRKTTVIGY
jgi:hypothetical protein